MEVLTFLNRPSPGAITLKRQRIPRACAACRERKVRCDGGTPVCGPCLDRDANSQLCIYHSRKRRASSSVAAPSDRPKVSRASISADDDLSPTDSVSSTVPSMHAIQQPPRSSSSMITLPTTAATITEPMTNDSLLLLAGVSSSFDSRDRPSPAPATSPAAISSSSIGKALDSLGLPSLNSGSSVHGSIQSLRSEVSPSTSVQPPSWPQQPTIIEADENADENEDENAEEENPDAMGAHLSSSSSGRSPSAFFGRSSTYVFTQRLKEIIASANHIPTQAHKLSRQSHNAATHLCHFSSYDILLPSRKLADHLVALYFRYTHNLYPFLHRPSFMETYESIWSGNESLEQKPYFYASLNIIFAIGGQFSDDIPTANREEALQIYFERANKILNLESLNMTGDLQMIQALLLTCQYLQGTKKANMCWNLVGLTVRIAQSNGLHIDADETVCENRIELELRRRLWWGCMLLDKYAVSSY